MQWLLLILTIPYLYLFLKISINLSGIMPYSIAAPASVFVSVVIACRNEEANLPSLLDYISAQDYPPGFFELFIIDDNSSDRTFSVASGYTGIKNLRVCKNNGKGKKLAIRTGIELSSGDLIITTDADCRPGKSWVSTIASFYEKMKPDLIICPVVLNGKQGFFHRFQELEFLGLQGVTAGCAVEGKPVMCNAANLSFTKETYNRHSGNLHDELISGDDVFLLHSIKKEQPDKIRWLESEKAIVTTKGCPTFRTFMNQRARWISKAGAYTDRYTKSIAIITFIIILLQSTVLIAGIFNPVFLRVFAVIFLLKSIPDLIILKNTASRYGKKNLLRWFLPSQFIYPFYVIAVLLNLKIR